MVIIQWKNARNFYPRPPRGGRRLWVFESRTDSQISIHALREEGDPKGLFFLATPWKFLSTPSARRATKGLFFLATPWKFLSTPSARRATSDPCIPGASGRYFYPRPPRGGRPVSVPAAAAVIFISIHALREEGDRTQTAADRCTDNFYPRPPRGGRQPSPSERR